MVQKLIEGIHRFRAQDFGAYETLFHELAQTGQKPLALFLACSDARVMPNLLTMADPGELVHVRNVGNIGPSPDLPGGVGATGAAIEFAVEVLGVGDIVICGHSHCGAMQALMNGVPTRASMPNFELWLSHAAKVREHVAQHYQHLTDPVARLNAAAEENVLQGVEHLRRYPGVARRLEAGELRVHGWFLQIETARLFGYDPTVRQFMPLARAGSAEPRPLDVREAEGTTQRPRRTAADPAC
jgi:carbonic anhydrase